MQRREFIVGLGGTVAVWPLASRAQQPAIPVIGFLNGGTPTGYERFAAAFRQGLNENGYIEGRNLVIQYRWGEDRYDRLPTLAADLVSGGVTVLAATSTPAALAAKAATSTIPIVFTAGADPVAIGLVASFNRPGGNATGLINYLNLLGAKRLELLHELVPNVGVIGILVNPTFPDVESQLREMRDAAQNAGLQVHVVNASSERDFEEAFATLVQLNVGALLVGADVLFVSNREQLVAQAAHHRIPTMYQYRNFVVAGGLMSYATNLEEIYRQAGIYVARILKGAKPSDLPVLLPTKFDLTINLETAKALGITVPETLLATADEVIQ
jgi:putative tryptophan/tyrosine transport system substrate-binding protein